MKIQIELNCDNAAFNDLGFRFEVERILDTCKHKIEAQLRRSDGCVCTAPEVDDKLLDINGNTVGYIRIEK